VNFGDTIFFFTCAKKQKNVVETSDKYAVYSVLKRPKFGQRSIGENPIFAPLKRL